MDSVKKLNILELPLELQKEIFKHSPVADLISLSLVSKAFREIAAANLYREFNFVFNPDDDDIRPVDALATQLDTFVTSDYDYAQFLKSVDFDTAGEKPERAYYQFTYDTSCGKFMNTLFLLTLKKSKALEKFKWNLRVELSRPVFQALHRITALKHLHVRLHTGESLYAPPRPLTSTNGGDDSHVMGIPLGEMYATHLKASILSDLSSTGEGNRARRKSSAQKKGPPKNPPTFSGFRNLQTLCVLDMDTVEYVKEIEQCIKNSSNTLHKLKLSLSESLAMKARTQVVENDDDDESDADDPFPPTPQPAVVISGPPATRTMEEEKKAQEMILGLIFGFGPSAEPAEEDNESGGEVEIPEIALTKSFIEDVRHHLSRLDTVVHGPGARNSLQKEIYATIVKAVTKYEAASKGESSTANASSDPPKPPEGETEVAKTEDPSEGTSGLFDSAKLPKKDVSSNESRPEDVDIEAPEAVDSNDWEATETEGQAEEVEGESEETTEPNTDRPTQPTEDVSHAKEDNEMREYVRETRGLALQTLEIYLVPIKASVLSRALDLKVLTRITLLNVGPQSPFWTLLQKENRNSPLPLSKIFTDNVTLPFLTLVSELQCVTELFLLERSTRTQRVESSAPKTTVTKRDIRNLALRPHAKNLKKLLIKNESDYSWDMTEKTILLLCKKAKNMEELAITCGIKILHTLLQNINGLINLRALQIVNFRSEDTCIFVIQELRKFAVDILTCYPKLKLEYIFMINTLTKITRSIKKPGSSSSGKGKGKGKAPAYNPAFLPIGDGDVSSSEEEDSGDEGECGSGVELGMEEMKTWDVEGVRIFREDVRSGKL